MKRCAIAARRLGILAGDHTKAAATRHRFHGISLFYREGYFQQQITTRIGKLNLHRC